MTRGLFLPRDAAAIAVGADEVATALQQAAARSGAPADIVRTGTRGMLWLEPLLEVEIGGVRYAFGPLEADHDVTASGRLAGRSAPGRRSGGKNRSLMAWTSPIVSGLELPNLLVKGAISQRPSGQRTSITLAQSSSS